MPQFSPGEVKTARAPITVKPSGLSCSTELYLVSNGAKVVTSGIKTFTSTGARQDISLPITMPGEGTYPVYLDIFANGLLIGAYQATEDVIIEVALVPFTFSNFVARKIVCPGATAWNAVEISCLITNPHSMAVTQDVAIMWARYSRTYGQWINCEGSFGGGTRWDCICNQMSSCLVNPFPVTLQPGSSINFFYAGHCYPDPSDPSFHPCAPLLPRNYNWYWWLEDGTGNKSAERSFST